MNKENEVLKALDRLEIHQNKNGHEYIAHKGQVARDLVKLFAIPVVSSSSNIINNRCE